MLRPADAGDGADTSRWVAPDSLPAPQRAGAPSAATLLRRLRWAALGVPYRWTARSYDTAAPPGRPLPPPLAARASSLAAALTGCACLRADVALVNYYGPGDTLGGHVDDAEAALDKPIVSFSLGVPAVFLLGHVTRDAAPTPLLLRGGDALLLSGAARRAVHGLPRVLTPADEWPPAEAAAAAVAALAAAPPGDEAAAVAAWMAHTRINVSVRDIS